jgi:hypothetical protein
MTALEKRDRAMTQPSAQYRPRTWRWIASGGIGLAAAVAYYQHFVKPNVADALSLGIVLIYLVVLFWALAYVLLFRLALPKLQPLSRRARIAWIGIALAAGGGLGIIIPQPPPGPVQHRLAIVATGQKNPAAKSSQVWFSGLYRSDDSQVAVSTFSSDGTWEMRDGMLASLQGQPATLHWEGMLAGDARVQFVSHPWSGIVRLQWDDQTQTVDLYADVEQNTSKTITLPADTEVSRSLMASPLSLLFYSIDAFTLGMVVLAASTWLLAKRRFSV